MSLGFDPHADYYSTLGVSENASQDEISKAYRKMALKYHPDRNPGNAESEVFFKKAGEAKEVLLDSRKKRDYDNLRSTTNSGFGGFGGFGGSPFSSGGGSGGNPFNSSNNPFDDIFSDFVNARRRGGSGFMPDAEEGEDITIQVHISLEEAYNGCKKEVVSRSGKLVPCGLCNGKGGEPGTKYIECPNCKGLGRRINPRMGMRGMDCTNCSGSGKVPIQLCKKCHGKRRTNHEKSITITIPAGVDEGSKLRVSGQGSPGVNAPPGDLMVIIHVSKNAVFERKESDLFMEHWIPLHTAIKGGDTTIKSVNGGDLKFKVPPNVKSGVTTIRLKGKGMENPMRHTRGDLHVMLEILMPESDSMSPKAKQLFDELIEELENSNKE